MDPPTCSFVLAGWSKRRNAAIVKHLASPQEKSGEWLSVDVDMTEEWQQYGCVFAGNGVNSPVEAAWEKLKTYPTTRPEHQRAYSAFLSILDNPAEPNVGGHPQIALLGTTRKFVGVEEPDGSRFLLGHKVASGAKKDVIYANRDLSNLNNLLSKNNENAI